MAEELRFFIRTALYLAIADVIYWFMTYEWAGTVLLGTLALGAIFFAFAARATTEASGAPSSRGLLSGVERVVGFRDPPGGDRPLAIDDDPIPPASIWPAVGALGGLLLALGLIYGAWFWLPGAALALLSLWGWLTELE
jgi:hypothetical protein